jgi:hypothetical protein
VQRLARRALLVLGVASTSQIMREWTCCGKPHRGKPIRNHDNRAARRVLGQPFQANVTTRREPLAKD